LSSKGEKAAEMMEKVSEDDELNMSIANAVSVLWTEDAILNAHKKGGYYVLETSAYFFDKVQSLADPSYSFTAQDIVSAKVSISKRPMQCNVDLHGVYLTFVDFGYHSHQFNKLVPYLESFTSIIFLSALSGYCAYVPETYKRKYYDFIADDNQTTAATVIPSTNVNTGQNQNDDDKQKNDEKENKYDSEHDNEQEKKYEYEHENKNDSNNENNDNDDDEPKIVNCLLNDIALFYELYQHCFSVLGM
ncbi:hypothetical protein RFI_33596, partial [Reticulomyxa filosa]